MIDERRRGAMTLAALMAALSGICGWLLLDSLSTLLAAVQANAPVIRVDSGDAAILVLLPIFAGLAAFGIIAIFRPFDLGATMGRRLTIATIVALPLALAAPWAFRFWMADMLVARGYVRCEPLGRPTRFPTATFARPPSRCETAPTM